MTDHKEHSMDRKWKMHWCPYCAKFVNCEIKEVGYYHTPKLICLSCRTAIGTPE